MKSRFEELGGTYKQALADSLTRTEQQPQKEATVLGGAPM